MENIKSKSLIEVAIYIQESATEPITFIDLFNKVAELKEYTDEDKKANIARFYTDVTASGDFIYCGDDKWDLKKNQKLDAQESDFSKEHGAEFADDEEVEEEKPKRKSTRKKNKIETIEDIVEEEERDDNTESEDQEYENQFDDYYNGDDDDGYDGYEKDFDSEIDEDDLDSDDDFDEDKYNSIMDEFEDQYND